MKGFLFQKGMFRCLLKEYPMFCKALFKGSLSFFEAVCLRDFQKGKGRDSRKGFFRGLLFEGIPIVFKWCLKAFLRVPYPLFKAF